ncbi:MAG TPA: AsmA-like C-terminal region-containing protein [Candidatus Binatia bacterium]
MRRGATGDDALARALGRALDAQADDAARGAHPDEAQVARYLSRELAPDEVERFERHVAACARCAEELAIVAALEADAASATSPAADVDERADVRARAVASASARDERGAHAARAAQVERTAHAERGERVERVARVERAKPRRRRLRWLRIAAGLAVVLLAGGAVAGNWAVGRLQPTLVAGMASALGREVSGGSASLVLAGGPGLRLDDLRVAEDPRFGGGAFATVEGAVLRVDPRELLRGRVRGAIALEAPAVHLIRDGAGIWNIETLAGREPARGVGVPPGLPPSAATPPKPGSADVRKAKERLVRLTSATIENGTLEITDEKGGGKTLALRDLDLRYTSDAPTEPSAIQLSGTLGASAQRIALRGEIGPFEGGATPRWSFDEVELARLPLADIPGAPQSLTGELTFTGSLASEGRGIETIVANASGKGELGLCCGELRERNLFAELVAALAREAAHDGDVSLTAHDLLERARQVPALASALAPGATPFEDIAGSVEIASGSVSFDDLAVDTSLFRASATGSLTHAGALDVQGTVTLGADATRALVALLPEAGRLFAQGAELEVPFKAAGRWPDVRLEVDVRTAIARAAAPLDPRALRVVPLLARVAG